MLSIPFSTFMWHILLGDHQKLKLGWRLKTKACSSKNKRGDGSLWDIRLLAFLMFINLQSLLVTLVTTKNRTQKHKISNGKNRDEMTVYRSYWDELTAKIWSKNIIALKKSWYFMGAVGRCCLRSLTPPLVVCYSPCGGPCHLGLVSCLPHWFSLLSKRCHCWTFLMLILLICWCCYSPCGRPCHLGLPHRWLFLSPINILHICKYLASVQWMMWK